MPLLTTQAWQGHMESNMLPSGSLQLRRASKAQAALLIKHTDHKAIYRYDPNTLTVSLIPEATWERALRADSIEDFRFHDLRHSAAIYLAMNGASLIEIAEVLCHKTLAMVRRYSHLTEAHIVAVVARMNRVIFE